MQYKCKSELFEIDPYKGKINQSLDAITYVGSNFLTQF